MKKVLHLLASNKFSGAENVVCTIINNFKDEFEMVYCSPFGSIENTLKEKNIKYYGLDKFNNKNLKKIIKEFNPDIIHAHDYKASTLAAMSGFKGKIISHLHNNCPFAKNWNLKTILYSLTIKKYYKIIGVSDKVLEEAIFKNKIKPKYKTIYNFVDEKMIINKSNEYIYPKQYDLFFIGRLTEQKNPYIFIEIVKNLKNEYNEIKAVMIGDGELKENCIQLINDYKLSDNIELIGFIENPFPVIKQCKIGIMPSKWEGFGLTAIETLILEKPVLNSGVGGLGEIFKDNKEYICNAIEEYVEKYKKYITEANNNSSYKRITKNFCDLEKWEENLKQIY